MVVVSHFASLDRAMAAELVEQALRVQERVPLSCPITCLSAIPGTSYALAGTARRLVLVNVDSCNSTRSASQAVTGSNREWDVFERERIHRVVWRPVEGVPAQREALVLGGKEAALIELQLPPSQMNSDSRCATC